MRAYQDRSAYVKEDRQATVEVRVDEEALESAVRRLGWRLYSTNQPAQQLSLEQAVLAYRSAYLVERSLGRLSVREDSDLLRVQPHRHAITGLKDRTSGLMGIVDKDHVLADLHCITDETA